MALQNGEIFADLVPDQVFSWLVLRSAAVPTDTKLTKTLPEHDQMARAAGHLPVG